MNGRLPQETLGRLADIGYDALAGPIVMSEILHQLAPGDDILIIIGDSDPTSFSRPPSFHGNQFMVLEDGDGERRFVGRQYEGEAWGEVRVLNPRKPLRPNLAGIEFTLRKRKIKIPTICSIVVIRSSVIDAASEAVFSVEPAE